MLSDVYGLCSDVLRRRRSICSCPSAQVFNLIIGLSIFSRKGRKSAAQSNCSSSRSSEIKAATRLLLSCSGSSGCSLVVSQIVPRQFSEAFDIMFWRGYSSSAVCKRFAATPSIDFRHLTALSFDLSRRLGLVWSSGLALGLGVFCILIAMANLPGRPSVAHAIGETLQDGDHQRTGSDRTGFPAGCTLQFKR